MSIVHVFFVLLLIGPILWGIRNWLKYKEVSAPKTLLNYATLINSAVLYALAFNIIFFLQELFLVLGKKALGLTAFLYHNDHTWTGEHPMASLMQGSGALAIFIFGWISLAVFHFLRNSNNSWKLFVLWLAFHGLIQSIPQVVVAYFDPNTDVGEALVGYLQISQPILIILAIISCISIAFISIWFSKLLLEFAPVHNDLSNPKIKLKYIRLIAVGGGLLGSILVVPFRIFPMSQAITPFIIFIFSIPWLWSAAPVHQNVHKIPNKIKDKILWIPIAFLIILLLVFQMVLAPGVEF